MLFLVFRAFTMSTEKVLARGCNATFFVAICDYIKNYVRCKNSINFDTRPKFGTSLVRLLLSRPHGVLFLHRLQ